MDQKISSSLLTTTQQQPKSEETAPSILNQVQVVLTAKNHTLKLKKHASGRNTNANQCFPSGKTCLMRK